MYESLQHISHSTCSSGTFQDHGRFDGIQRVFFGGGLRFWLHKLLLLDSLSYLSHGQLSLSLSRMVLVDVDDIFVGEKGTRLRKDDVMALLTVQQRIQSLVPGFKFNLGFSGKYFHHGTFEENAGDDMLLENVDKYGQSISFSITFNCQSDFGEFDLRAPPCDAFFGVFCRQEFA